MEKFISETVFHLNQYLYDELIKIICSYLIGFNTMSLDFEKSFDISEEFGDYEINIYKNKIYLVIRNNGIIIIYDMVMDKTIYFDTNMKKNKLFL